MPELFDVPEGPSKAHRICPTWRSGTAHTRSTPPPSTFWTFCGLDPIPDNPDQSCPALPSRLTTHVSRCPQPAAPVGSAASFHTPSIRNPPSRQTRIKPFTTHSPSPHSLTSHFVDFHFRFFSTNSLCASLALRFSHANRPSPPRRDALGTVSSALAGTAVATRSGFAGKVQGLDKRRERE